MSRSKIILLIIICGLAAIWFSLGNRRGGTNKTDENSTYEAMVVIRDQKITDPIDDAKNSLKRGDVIVLRPEGHEWSHTEYVSYLLVKINTSQKKADSLLEPLTKSGTGPQDQDNIIRARRYGIDLQAIGFAGDQVVDGQPLEEKIYDENVIVEKK